MKTKLNIYGKIRDDKFAQKLIDKFINFKEIKKNKVNGFSEKHKRNKFNFNTYELENDTKNILKKRIINLEIGDTINIFRYSYPDDIVHFVMNCFKREKFSITLKNKNIRSKSNNRSKKRLYTITRIK